MQKQPSEGFFKIAVMRNFAEFIKIYICGGIFFFDKLNSVDLHPSAGVF